MHVSAQSLVKEEQPDDSLKTSLSVYPLLFYYPKTRLGIGVTGVLSFFPGKEKGKRPSQLLTGLAYTGNRQILLSTFFDLFLMQDQLQVEGEVAYYDYFYPYYGLSNKTDPEVKEKYFVRFPRLRANVLRSIHPHWKVGLGVEYDGYKIIEIAEKGSLDRERPLGWDGSQVFSASVLLRLDSRDRVYSPQKGALATFTQSFSPEGVGTGNYSRSDFIGAYYQGLWKKSVLALNMKVGHITGEAPFQERFYLGGAKNGRGIIQGRYRGEDRLLFQAEVRQSFLPRWGATLFASTGTVADHFDQVFSTIYHTNAGGGIRFMLQPKTGLNFRLDCASGDEGLQFYFSVGETF